MKLLSDIQYFPSVIFFKISYNFQHIVFEQYESYQKMSFRNRCQITGAQGMVDLSIPLVRGRGQKTLIKDVRIDSRRSWQAQHWKTIVTCYSGSPWFGFYRDELEALYRQPADFLMDWDLVCLEWAFRALGMTRTIGLTGEYREAYEAEDGFTDWRGRLMPRNREHWEEARYHQVFEDRTGFIPNLSILDLLFCEGREAIRYIRS
jgi:WbqC-like protein family